MILRRVGWVKAPTAAAVGVAVALLALLAQRAQAHTELVAAYPAPGQSLPEPPTEIWLAFNEPLGPGSTFVVLTETFTEIGLPTPEVDPADPARLATDVPDGALAPGTYTVQWFVTSADGHPATGSYAFGVDVGGPGQAGRGWLAAAILVVSFAGLAWLAKRARPLA